MENRSKLIRYFLDELTEIYLWTIAKGVHFYEKSLSRLIPAEHLCVMKQLPISSCVAIKSSIVTKKWCVSNTGAIDVTQIAILF